MKNRSNHIHASLSGHFLVGNDLKVNRLGFGAMRLTGPHIWGETNDKNEAKNVLKTALELGINLFDTADSYGPETSENILAETLFPYSPDLVIATKGGLIRPSPKRWDCLGRPDYLMQCVEMSLRRLKLDCLDLYQLHAVDPLVPIEDSLSALKQMQDQGKIRHIGLSNVSIKEIERAKKIVPIVSVQNQYNLIYRYSEDVLKYCEKNQLGFIPWYPLASGSLAEPGSVLSKLALAKGATPAQLALAWLLKKSPVMLPIPGTSSVTHLIENVASVLIELTPEEFKVLDALD